MIDPSRHAQQRGSLESLLRSVPGFKGYAEKEDRRESDRLTRKWMADRLQQSKRGLDDAMRKLVDDGQLDALTPFERLRSRLDGFVAKLLSAVRGYSGFFDFVQVGEDVLDQIYQFDLTLVGDVQALAETLEQLPGRADLGSGTASELLGKLDVVERSFERRGEILKGVAPT